MSIQTLREAFRGQLVVPGHEEYDAARAVWNASIDRRPAVVARCTGPADVLTAVRWARDNDMLVALRGGAHNVAGLGTCDDGIVIDMSGMRAVRVDPASRTAVCQGGAVWRDMDHETQAFGLAAPGGIVSTTGVAGLTLGGGFGWLSRRYGLTCDNLVAADVVTADGQFRHVSADRDPGLFWALRGGGGNFGAVTAFGFNLHPVGPGGGRWAGGVPGRPAVGGGRARRRGDG
jgi:FAD/FMN-containing dehydrogenase